MGYKKNPSFLDQDPNVNPTKYWVYITDQGQRSSENQAILLVERENLDQRSLPTLTRVRV